MLRRALYLPAVLLAAAIAASAVHTEQLWYAPSCLHQNNAQAFDRARRAAALELARAINKAQAEMIQRTGSYQPFERLGTLPAVPRGFDVTLFSDRSAYLFALRDRLDPCRFAVFSDERGLLYQESALDAPVVAQ